MSRDEQASDGGQPADERARGTPRPHNDGKGEKTRAERLWDAVRKWVEGVALPWP